MTYIRDTRSNAVINTDDSHYRSILLRREQQRKCREVEEQLDEVRDELAQIKSLLQKVINGKNYG